MRRPLLALLGILLGTSALAQEDLRQSIQLPPAIREAFLAEMRGHMSNLDDILAALAVGEFDEAARVAEINMDFGHSLWQVMAEGGASDEEIAQAKERFRAAGHGAGQGMGMGGGQGMGRGAGQGMGRGQGMGMGQGQGMGQGAGPVMGMGRFMPDDFRAMGVAFHEAAQEFAVAARAAGDPPSVEDYQNVLDHLWAITANCRACHESFRIE